MRKIKTCLVIPGLDAIFSKESAQRWKNHPIIKSSFEEASSTLESITGVKEDLHTFYFSEKRPHLKDFDRTLISLTTLQVAIAKTLKLDNRPDMIVSCSHGDIARSVLGGVITLSEAVGFLWYFSILRQDVPAGHTANVRRWDGEDLSEEQINWLVSRKLNPSVWGPKNVTVAGDSELLEKADKESETIGLKIRKTLPYPVHSPLMEKAASSLLKFAEPLTLGKVQCLVLSSVRVDWLETDDDFRQECFESSIKPIRWHETFKFLNTQLDIERLINIGPSNNLISLVFEDRQFDKSKLIDAFDLLEEHERC